MKRSDLAKKTLGILIQRIEELNALTDEVALEKELAKLISPLANMDLYKQDANHFRNLLANYRQSSDKHSDREEIMSWLKDRVELYRLLDFEELDSSVQIEWNQILVGVLLTAGIGSIFSWLGWFASDPDGIFGLPLLGIPAIGLILILYSWHLIEKNRSY